eukprot:gene4016-4266_t
MFWAISASLEEAAQQPLLANQAAHVDPNPHCWTHTEALWLCLGVLCDNLLQANWSPHQLSHLAILGNSFASYQVRWGAPSSIRPSTPRPDKLLQLVELAIQLLELVRSGCSSPDP